jgi:glycosyltransferase involved in cell wall biosynthesis
LIRGVCDVRKLLVLDSSYSLESIRANKLEDSVTCRDLDGFFNHVWTVHPFATLVTSKQWSNKYGRPEIYKLTSAHTFIEGKVGRFQILHKIAPLNFLIGQIYIFFFLKNLVKKEKISVIRVGSPLYLGLLGWALSRWCQIPFVIRVGANHDKIFETTGKQMEKRLFLHRSVEKLVERFVFPRANLVAGANQNNLNFALSNGATREFSTLFRYGNLIDKRHFVAPSKRTGGNYLLQELGIGASDFLLYIGRLESVKHPDDVLKVLAQLMKRGYPMKAVLAGDGKMRSELLNFARELGVESQIVFAGNVDQDWLSKVIPIATAVVSPHTGRALSEAALGGVPIVAYDVDWQGELIQTGITGELVPHLDHEAMANSLERYLKDPVYSHKMGESVRNHIMEMMDPETLDQHERDQYMMTIERFNKQTHPH